MKSAAMKLAMKSGLVPRRAVGPEKELLRGCVDRLSQIEGRLDIGCGDEWHLALRSIDDMVGLGLHLVRLQKLTSLNGSAESAWLEATCTASELSDDQHAELSRRLLRHLDDIDRVVPPARNPADMLGESILKYFDGHGIFMGTIVEYDQHTGFRLQARLSCAHACTASGEVGRGRERSGEALCDCVQAPECSRAGARCVRARQPPPHCLLHPSRPSLDRAAVRRR